ncbi:MAG: hypothetical protein Q9160_004997 [Pyrenula sp. 1 TL-2023]
MELYKNTVRGQQYAPPSSIFLPSLPSLEPRPLLASLTSMRFQRRCSNSATQSPVVRSESSPITNLGYSSSDVAGNSTSQKLENLLERFSKSDLTAIDAFNVLSDLLESNKSSWPVFKLVLCFQRFWHSLPEVAKCEKRFDSQDVVRNVEHLVKAAYTSIAEFLPADADTPAIIDGLNPDRFLSHRSIHDFARGFDLRLPVQNNGKPRVVVALPNGSMMGLACIAVITYYTLVPMVPNVGAEQFRADVERVEATGIIVLANDAQRLRLEDPTWINKTSITVFVAKPRDDMTFDVELLMSPSEYHAYPDLSSTTRVPNTADDIAMMLFTSGTSGTKKVVPISMHSMIAGVALVIDSWALGPSDCCLNMMPLYHINLLAPIMSGGSTICCSSFDPNLFWDLVEDDQKPTWYYASPSMHAAILLEVENRKLALEKSCIRLVCNAAGGLLPTLASELRDTFGCTVLPSYGMTECMPIATPPLTYCLDRPGTSGVTVGPEVAILSETKIVVPSRTPGNIHIRGLPVFSGYLLENDELDTSAFTEKGWFDTGDQGFLDEDGYLYITGRSKEVINRGGEIISPFEVEEAILSASHDSTSTIFGRVSETLAFSMPHSMLQEVVGIVIVTPPEKPRPSLQQLHEAIRDSLHHSKWPVVVVYMIGLPKARNKVLRIKFAERLEMEPVTDDTDIASRYYEAVCPPLETDLTINIPRKRCYIDHDLIRDHIQHTVGSGHDVFVCSNGYNGLSRAVLFQTSQFPNHQACTKNETLLYLEHRLREVLHGYLIPSSIKVIDRTMPRCADGTADKRAIIDLLDSQDSMANNHAEASFQKTIAKTFASILSCPVEEVSHNTDFFEAGGDSLGAGRLLSLLRKQLELRLGSDTLFAYPTVEALANYAERATIERRTASLHDGSEKSLEQEPPKRTKMHSSTRPLVLFLHLLPLAVIYPLIQGFWWILFLYGMAELFSRFPFRFLLVAAAIVVPLFGVIFKWIVIGRYRPGLYPMWTSYHNRWWITEKTLQLCGRGIFNQHQWLRTLYLRLLGAKIGKNVSIHEKAQLGEFDLISIEDGVTLDRHSIIRPFAAEKPTSMLLSPICIGRNSSVGLCSVIAPGTSLPENTCIGPNSSSWEVKDASENNRDLLTSKIPQPHWLLRLLVIEPIWVLAWLANRAPWLAGLIGIISNYPQDAVLGHTDMVKEIAIWYTVPKRIGFHYLARVSGAVFGPIALFQFVILVKKMMCSRWIGAQLQPNSSARKRSQLTKLYTALMYRLVPAGDLSEIAALFGSHYEIMSVLMRALGANVGKRVYWPGVGPSVQDHELLDIGDDVVFGSRSHLVTSDGTGSDTITLSDGCMVADRAVVLPGSFIGKRTVLGSGSLTRRNGNYPSDTIWVGSKKGDSICLTASGSSSMSKIEALHDLQNRSRAIPEGSEKPEDDDNSEADKSEAGKSEGDSATATPFGHAFYGKRAPYHVLGLASIICYSTLTTIFTSIYWNTSSVLSIRVIARVLQVSLPGFRPGPWFRPVAIYGLMSASIAVICAVQAVLALSFIIAAKWLLIGRRRPGSYDWDESSYCQRWQLLLTVERLRRACFRGKGILGLLTGTHYLTMYFRALGARIGRDCALFANGRTTLLFTEPELLTLGERVTVDDASLVCHVNSRGRFKLHELSVGDRAVLRTGSRLLAGAKMEKDSCLLEHTLVMSGDTVDEGETVQGWPGEEFRGKRV